ncbi:MAG: hypothetical protein IM581_14355 [Chitinophagaceae bacterium]|nr:hypothetical protein [Chitinophagaceae bacterium]
MNEDFDEIDLQIIDQLKGFMADVVEKEFKGNRVWTRNIKERLCALGTKLKCRVAVGGFRDEYEQEWLYDITWYEEDSENRLIRIPLIVESEWDTSYIGIKYDFEKLLVGNAVRRLLI